MNKELIFLLLLSLFIPTVSVSAANNFSIIALPDLQNYSDGWPAIGLNQTEWIVNNTLFYNIVYVTTEGDIVNTPSTKSYRIMDNTLRVILNSGLPFTLIPGNHDGDDGLALYKQYFPLSWFSGKSYYGGHYGSDNLNNYVLFDVSGLSFIAVGLNYNPSSAELAWADDILETYSYRRAIVIEHCILNNDGSWEGNGQAVYDSLKKNTNLFLMLCGHINGENRRTETYNGHTVNILLADYQDYPNGGDGYLRIMEFSPSTNQISVKTYSPYHNKYETDANSQFSLSYDMSSNLPCINLNKQANVTSAVVGQTITYTYTVTNCGGTPLSGITLTDSKLGTIKLGATILATGATTSGNKTYIVKSTDTSPITNSATVTGTSSSGSAVTSTDVVTIPISSSSNNVPGFEILTTLVLLLIGIFLYKKLR